MTKFYAALGTLIVSALAWAHFIGWTPGDVDEVRDVPKSVRNNPGSYRPIYAGSSYRGAK